MTDSFLFDSLSVLG